MMMKKYFYTFILLVSSLHAEIEGEALSSIYKEAALFVVVGLVMSVVSYVVSSRHAKKYAVENQKNIDAKKEENKEIVKSKEDRIEELLKMLDDKTITEDEFKMLKKRMYNTEV